MVDEHSFLDRVSTFVLDVDGVLTNGDLLITEQGEMLRTMNIRDGYAIKNALNKGYRVAIITGGGSKGVRDRLAKLGVQDIYDSCEDKPTALRDLMEKYKLDGAEVLYMGDDLPDYEVMGMAGIKACPADAAPEIKAMADYISPLDGGSGCVRDVIEKVLHRHAKWHS